MERKLSVIAKEIRADWKDINFAAWPYLNAMEDRTFVDDKYFNDSGTSIVLYFLSNASSWRGPTARRIKAELKSILKQPVGGK